MLIESLRLINFRNYTYQDLAFHPRINLFYGDNAQGKTNLLEAVYYSARGRSFKTSSDKSLIRFGERSAYIRSALLMDEPERRKKIVEFKFSMVDRKRVRINEVELENLKELTDQFAVVLFAPQDLALIEGGPEGRRAYLDEILKETDPSYALQLARYRRVLGQRNHLLKGPQSEWFSGQLQALDLQLSRAAAPIFEKRARLMQGLQPFLSSIHKDLSDGRERMEMSYQACGSADPKCMQELLEEHRKKDLDQTSTSLGPQKDDLEIYVNGNPARAYASRGQARTLTLTLKLAELKWIQLKSQIQPILLLDDVFSELDAHRSRYLMEAIAGFQTLMTSNEAGEIPLPADAGCRFHVQAGHVEKAG